MTKDRDLWEASIPAYQDVVGHFRRTVWSGEEIHLVHYEAEISSKPISHLPSVRGFDASDASRAGRCRVSLVIPVST